MAKDFKHLSDTVFPHYENVNVYKYENDFDYSRYNYSQMRLTVCRVPWDMGEAHIGNRTISGIGNVVYFGDKAKRDKWFTDIPAADCIRLETKYKDLHRDNTIVLPIPFDVLATYNYLAVEYELFANDNSPVMYEKDGGARKWFWFIREVEMLSANSTRVHLLNDAWQTFIYDLNVSNMVLERGHAPMGMVDVETYLSDPVDNCKWLLAEDVNFADADVCKHTDGFIFNSENMKAVFITTANPSGNWKDYRDDWITPGAVKKRYVAFALDVEDLNDFVSTVSNDTPQFFQTVKALAFVSADLLTLDEDFTFGGVTCNRITAHYQRNTVYTLSADDFGYPTRYKDIAKLYTYPYAYIEISDEEGNVSEIRIENTNGEIRLESCVNTIFPWLSISCHLVGVGKAERQIISFTTIGTHNMPIQGAWYKYMRTLEIPTIGIVQDSAEHNDYSTHFDRVQQALVAANDKTSADASADTAKGNADRSATADKDAADNTAGMVVSNANLQAAANSATTTAGNTMLDDMSVNTTTYNSHIAVADNQVVTNTASSTIAANEQQAAVSSASGAVNAGANAAMSLATGNVVGAIGAAVSGATSVAATLASTSIGNNLTAYNANVTVTSNGTHEMEANLKNIADTYTQKTKANADLAAANALTTGAAANQAANIRANAALAYGAATGNAADTCTTDKDNAARAKNSADNAIINQIKQAALNAPAEFGVYSGGQTMNTRPMGIFANVVTQNQSAIAQAGDTFLRYGYAYNGVWNFDGNWAAYGKFCYWKLKDFWVSGLQIPDMYVDKIRFFLFGGVTVWSNPADIGNTSIYQNV